MEFAVYRIFYDADGRKLGAFVNMFSSHEKAEELMERLEGEHQIVELWTRELGEEDDYSTVVFGEAGVVAPRRPRPERSRGWLRRTRNGP